MNKIKILENVKNETNYIIRLEFAIPIPASLQALENKVEILNSFKTIYSSLHGLLEDNVIYRTQSVFENDATEAEIKATIEATYNYFESKLNSTTILPCDILIGKTWDGSEWS